MPPQKEEKRMNPDELNEILGKNALWLTGVQEKEVRADLRLANLRGVNLTEAAGAFATGYFGKHQAVAAGGYISIGCERHTYQEWLDKGEQIGKKYEYTDAEIARYMAWIRLVVDWLTEVENEISA